MGPWFHGGLAGLDMPAEYLRWFDHWLKGVDNGVLEEPALHYWTLNAAEGSEWRGTDAWPLPSERRTAFHFRAGPSGSVDSVNDGLLAEDAPEAEGGDAYRVDYTASSGIDNRWTWTAGGGTVTEAPKPLGVFPYPDMRGNDAKGLTYTSATLEHAVRGDRPSGGAPVGDLERGGRRLLRVSRGHRAGRALGLRNRRTTAGLPPAPGGGALRAHGAPLPPQLRRGRDAAGARGARPAQLRPLSPPPWSSGRGTAFASPSPAPTRTPSPPRCSIPPPKVSVLRGGARASRIVLPVIP